MKMVTNKLGVKLDSNGYAPSLFYGWTQKSWKTKTIKPDLVRHEVFYGTANRKLSKEYGCWVYLEPEWHNMSNKGVHFNKELDLQLKRECQAEFEMAYPDLDFVKIFGKNYL